MVVDRDRVYALNGEDSRTLGAERPYSGAIRWGGQAQGICRDCDHGNRVADHVEELDRVSFFGDTRHSVALDDRADITRTQMMFFDNRG